MLMVTFGLAASGYSNTFNPLGKSYSVTPPREAFFWTPVGSVWHSATPAGMTKQRKSAEVRLMMFSVKSGFLLGPDFPPVYTRSPRNKPFWRRFSPAPRPRFDCFL